MEFFLEGRGLTEAQVVQFAYAGGPRNRTKADKLACRCGETLQFSTDLHIYNLRADDVRVVLQAVGAPTSIPLSCWT